MWTDPYIMRSNVTSFHPASLLETYSSTLSSLNSVIIWEKITKIPASIKTVNTSANEYYLSSQHGELVIRDWWKTACLNLDPCHLHQLPLPPLPPPNATRHTHTLSPQKMLKDKRESTRQPYVQRLEIWKEKSHEKWMREEIHFTSPLEARKPPTVLPLIIPSPPAHTRHTAHSSPHGSHMYTVYANRKTR